MGKDKKTTVDTSQTTSQTGGSRSGIDAGSQAYIENFLRPLGQEGVDALRNAGPFFHGPTGTFQEGVAGLQGAAQGAGGIAGQAQGYQGMDFNAALRGYQPNIGDAGGDWMRQYMASQQGQPGAGALGFSAQKFNPAQAQQFFSPYEDQVVGAAQANFDRQREQALSRSAAEATSRGAFGGSRSGILQSESLRNVNQDEAQQLSSLRNQGFQTAMGQAMGAHQSHQQTGLQAAMANQQGRLQDASRLGQLGLSAAGMTQQGQIEGSRLGLQRAMGMQGGDMASAQTGLQGLGMGLNALGMQGQMAQGMIGAGETERQALNQVAQDPLLRRQAMMGQAQAGYGGPTGQSSSFNQQGSQQGTQTNTQHGNLMGDILGAGLGIGSMFLGGAPAAAMGALGGQSGSDIMQGLNLPTSLFGGGGGGGGGAGGSPFGQFQGLGLGAGGSPFGQFQGMGGSPSPFAWGR